MKFRSLLIGDFVESIAQNTSFGEDFDLDLLGGRRIVILFAGDLQSPRASEAIGRLRQQSIFDGKRAVLLVVLCTGSEGAAALEQVNSSGFGVVHDRDFRVSRHFGAAPIETDGKPDIPFRQSICVLSPRLQVEHVFDIEQIDRAIASIAEAEKSGSISDAVNFAPILIIPNVFEAELRGLLIELYRKEARAISGAMRRSGSQTIEVVDKSHKVRRDYLVEDQAILDVISSRVRTRVRPDIRKIHQFDVTRLERNLVGCYTAEDGGHFRPHRDNTTPATAHRRFALSVNLNDDFDGGEVYFPEYGTRSYRAPAGGAVVFSCSLLHAVTRVTRGARYAYLPFLYDAEGSRIRAANINSYAGASFQPLAS